MLDFISFQPHHHSFFLILIFFLLIINVAGSKNVDEGVVELMTARFDQFEEMVAPLVRKIKTKVGSELGKSEVECFPKATLPIAELPDFVASISPSSDACKYVYKEVLTYTEGMMANAQLQNVGEEKYIHLPTFALMRTLVNHFLPDSEIQFFEKSSGGAVEIAYTTLLETPNGLLPVKGETDQVVAVGDAPVGNIEVKNLDKTCSTPNELGEILAEDKGLAERHRERIGIEPRLFPSVLVSGRRWVFVDRSFDDGERYLLFPVLETFDVVIVGEVSECIVNMPNVLMVSRMLIRMIYAMEKLIKATAKKRKEAFDVYRADDDSEEGGDKGEPSDHDEDTEGPVKGPAAPDTSRRPAPSATTSNKRARSAGKKGTQSTLTLANMFRHDLNTLWQRAVVW
jgi:hypothetical protein